MAVFEPNDEPLWVVAEPGVVGGYTFDRAAGAAHHGRRSTTRPNWSSATWTKPARAANHTLTAFNPWLAVEPGEIEEVWFRPPTA